MKAIYKQKMFLKSKRQPPNLKKLLIKSKFSYKQQKKFEVTKCRESRWSVCKHIMERSTLYLKGENFTVNADMSCTVKTLST